MVGGVVLSDFGELGAPFGEPEALFGGEHVAEIGGPVGPMVFGVVEDVDEAAAIEREAFGEAALFEGLGEVAMDGGGTLIEAGYAIVGGDEVSNGQGRAVIGGFGGGVDEVPLGGGEGGEQGPVVAGEASEGRKTSRL